ncbi:nibrin [Polymixia lowei]
MWILKPLEPGGETHYLLPSKEYVVGRKNCDILLSNDQSISRAHAHLTATDQTLTLKDSSKYGTFVNNQRLPENQPLNLNSGDNVTFGVFHSKFSVDCQKAVVCSSCVDNDGKALLTQALLPLGGKLVNNWTQDCTHLVMPSIKVTIKTICALLCCRPIVKQEFFTEISKAVQQKLPPPKAESFIPEIDEPSLNTEEVSLGPKPERKQLFTGKTFVFLGSKQLKRLSTAVGFGGGRSHLLEEGSLPRHLLQSPQSCVIDIATGNSQALLPSSTTEWAHSVRKILQEKGLRFITESEIGLAVIHASCDMYCNPSNRVTDSESMQNVEPRIPSATLSQNAAVEETVLPAASLNITAYASNTEPSQRMGHGQVTGMMAVGETPEKNQNRITTQLGQSKPRAGDTANISAVADTMSPSFNTVANTDSQKMKAEKSQGRRNNDDGVQPRSPKANGGTRTLQQRQSPQKHKSSAQGSPQKHKSSAQGSPQKQATLTSFFQPVNKKRPLEDESSVQSEPKRTVPPSCTTTWAPSTSLASKQISSNTHSDTARAQSQSGSGVDLFIGPSEALSDRVSHPAQQGAQRKEIETEIPMEELESIMSEDMDYIDEPTPASHGQQVRLLENCSSNKKRALNSVEHSSSSKRLRVNPEEDVKSNQKPSMGLETSNRNQSLEMEEPTSSIKKQQVHQVEHKTTNQKSSKYPEGGSAANRNQHLQAVKNEEVSFVVDSEALDKDMDKPKELDPLKPTAVKQEAPVSETEEDLPKRLVLVEFKSLTVTAPLKARPQQMQGNSCTKNFKRFRKVPVPGSGALPQIIGGSDLLAHDRGTNSELDEWLKDAAEDERQSKREESLGDDLFRYNPSKLTRRR